VRGPIDGVEIDMRLDLDAPLGDRVLRDAESGEVVRRALPTPAASSGRSG
jgi:hypothetical protein